MTTSSLPVLNSEGRAEPIAAAWNAQRRRADDLLAAHHSWLEQAAQLVERQLSQIEAELADKCEEVKRLTAQCNALSEQLGRVEAASASVGNSSATSPRESDVGTADVQEDYRRRYEMALADLRELKAVNAELQRRVERANAAAANSPAANQPPAERLDWEAEKRRILAALESDFDEHDAQQLGERLKISEVLHATERVIAEKDRQIQELKRQLENQETHMTPEALERAIAERVIENDPIIQEERQRLQRMQEEWRNKLRQGEIELSIERAKLARMRTELEERSGDKINAPPPPGETSNTPEQPQATTSRRWLAKLGLTEADRQRRGSLQ